MSNLAFTDGTVDISGDPDYFYYTRLLYEDQIDSADFVYDDGVPSAGEDFNYINLSKVTLLPGQSFQSITVTLKTTLSGAALAVDNDSASSATGKIRSRLTYLDTDHDVSLVNDLSGTSEASSPEITLSANNIDAVGSYQAGGVDWGEWTQTVDVVDEEINNVNVVAFGTEYTGSGTFSLGLSADVGTISGFGGGDVYFNGNNAAADYFASVEYIIIPEPGTLMMAGIALASAGGVFLLRRRKRD